MRRSTCLTVGFSLTAVLLAVTQQVASADSGRGDQSKADAIETVVNAAAPAPAPTDGVRVPVAWGSKSFSAHGKALDIAIPSDDTGKVTLVRPGSGAGLTVGLPSSGNAAGAVIARGGTVIYDSSLPSTDVAVQVFDQGVRIQTVLTDSGAPTEFAYPVSVPTGGRMSVSTDGGILVLDHAGGLQGGFAPPWARDSHGASVPTRYEVRGSTVVQIIDTTNAAFPVVADPWLGVNLIDWAAWQYNAGYGWTLRVSPSWMARWTAGSYAVGAAGWDELYARYKNSGLNTNLDGMRDQFICHEQVVAIRDPTKPTWNLDEWRPNVSYLQTVNASCNSGGAVWFD